MMKKRFVFHGINLFAALPLFAALAAAAVVAVSCTPKNDPASRDSGAPWNSASSDESAMRGVSPAGDGAEPQKYAVVIGNGTYANITKLNNPVNDANDMEMVLQGLGFNVDTVINGSRVQMEEALERFKNRLSVSRNSYGFLFYAGHGVQSGGANYLIPVDADIRSESYLGDRAVSVQAMLDEINQAGNELNIVVLDACRDNPFSWSRSGSRGLQVVANQPSDSIIVYATSAGSTAADGEGRNGLFTSRLLNNLKTPGLEVNEIFRRTMGDVAQASNNAQRPAVYSQFPGIAYLGSQPSAQTAQPPAPPAPVQPAAEPQFGEVTVTPGSLTVSTRSAGTLTINGPGLNRETPLPAGGNLPISRLDPGTYGLTMRYPDGRTEERSIAVTADQSASSSFTYVPAPPPAAVPPAPAPAVTPAPAVQPAAQTQRPAPMPDNFVRINGGTFTMGSPASEVDRYSGETQRQVTVNGFYMGKYEVTQAEYEAVMGTNPSNFKGSNLPVEKVSWYDAVEYCNRRSQKEGLSPAYAISGIGDSRTVTWNRGSNGYRLPTEAEWEYACRGGTATPFSTGNNITTGQANYDGNNPYNNNAKGTYREKATAVGSFAANHWGLYDMHGNVWEWCWDWYGDYSSGAQSNPGGAASGSSRVVRGGSWRYGAQDLRSAFRGSGPPSLRSDRIGFRLVRP